ncbi:MAG: ribosomal-protein-alanine N-acetyltransferase [Dehalococcoidia bacterium]|nr:ribosomal-protein-alanine N-acetyltransferase [Dehalococcoidia bacterium]
MITPPQDAGTRRRVTQPSESTPARWETRREDAAPQRAALTPVPSTQITLRDMTRQDIRAVRRIESAAYADAWPARAFAAELANAFARYRVAIEQPAGADAVPAQRGAIAALRRRFSRRRDRERIAGFMGVWYMQDQMHLVTIAVDPALQGRVIGTRLLLDCLDLARTAALPEVVLEVRVGNTRAQALYERFGFHRAGTLSGYYLDNNEDAYVMLSGRLDGAAAVQRHAAIRDALRALGRFADIDRAPVSEDAGP